MLIGRPNGRLALLSAIKASCREPPLVAVWSPDDSAARRREVTCPAGVAVRVADVSLAPDSQQTDKSRPGRLSPTPVDDELDDVPDSEPAPEGAYQGIQEREDAVLHAEGDAPE